MDGVVIGPGMRSILATSSVLYGVEPSQGNILQYENVSQQWTQIGGPYQQFAANQYYLFALSSDGNVWQFQGNPNQWLQIGKGMTFLAAGGESLVAIGQPDGGVYRYEGIPMGWTRIGDPLVGMSTNGIHIVALTPDLKQTMMYCVDPPYWHQIGGAANQVYVANNAVYVIAPDGTSLMRYTGMDTAWLKVGQGWKKFGCLGLSLFAISQDGSVVGEFDGTPGYWIPFSNDATSITADSRSVYLANAQSVRQFQLVPDTAEAFLPQTKETNAQVSVPETGVDWIWSFKTADKVFAGYDGKVTVTLFWSGSWQQNLELPRTHYERGRIYFMRMNVSTHPTLQGISIGGQENFFDDQWNLATVTAYDPSTFNLYTFDVNQKIPNSGTIYVTPSSIQQVHTPPTGDATVFVWDYLGKDVAWGHTSIELDDGTYISWWPSGQNRDRMPLLPDIYSAPANDPQTYQDDVSLEYGHAPDWRVVIGGLDLSAIRSWWVGFKTTHRWATLSQNCSTTVADALWAGGASRILTSREGDNFQSIVVWTPNDVLAFGQTIQAHENSAVEAENQPVTTGGENA